MKNFYSLIISNILVFILIICLYLKLFNSFIIYLLLVFFLAVNIYIIYKKSNNLDKNEKKKKLILHNIKNSLSIILGYNEAFKDDIITRDELDKNINEEIEKIITVIKDEIYR